MPVDQALRLLSVLLASVSFIGLVLAASLPAWLTVLTASALMIALIRTSGLPVAHRVAAQITFSTTTWNIFVLLGFLVFWVDSLWVSRDLLHAGIHFLLILMVIKLGNLQLHRDYQHLYAISLVAVLAAASLTTDLWYFPVFLAYVVFGVWALLLFQVAKRSEEIHASALKVQPMREGPEKHADVTPQLLWMGNGLATATIGLTILMFFMIPRVGAGFYQKGIGENIRTSGFSNTVDLGSIGTMKRDHSVVMRVELPDGSERQGGQLYLRGSVFDRYNGRSWTNLLSHRHAVTENSPGTFVVERRGARESAQFGPPLRQHILLEPLDTTVLFAAPFAEIITGKLPAIQADVSGGLYLPFASPTRIEYSVVSRSHPVLPADRQAESVSYRESVFRPFMQVPDLSERIMELTQEIVRGKRNAYDKAVAIKSHLLQNYQYSLDVAHGEHEDPLEDFLFSRKTGYCEHYATAMAVMLRTQGIPARLITGFLATEWNEYGNYFVVRQQDAHAWVEVFLPHSGWVMMDPTPESGDSFGGAPAAWQTFGRMLDSVRLRWSRMVVQYSTVDQLAMVKGIQTGSVTAKNRARESLASIFDPLAAMMGEVISGFDGDDLVPIAGGGLVLTAICLFMWFSRKKVWGWGRGGCDTKAMDLEEPIMGLYKRMLAQLSRKGLLKPAAMGPLEFVRMTREHWAEAVVAVTTVTELYCRGRFGRVPITQEEYRSAEGHLQQLMGLERHATCCLNEGVGAEAIGAGKGI